MPELKILQPKNCKLDEIEHDFQQSAGKIVDTATYPNGFILVTETTPEAVKISSNKPLIKIDESTYQIPE